MKLYKKISPYFLIALTAVLSTFILWLPFILKQNFQTIYENYDGVLYIIPAKTFYSIDLSLPLSPIYFAAHLPIYPISIKILSFIFGYLKSMLFSNILFTLILSLFFYFLLKTLKLSSSPLIAVMVFLFLPRFLVIRSVGAPESLFMLLILASLFFFEKEKFWLAGLLGGLATMTKIPGVLLFPVYLLVFIERYFTTGKLNWRWIYILLIPLGLLSVFSLYWIKYRDFFAYFHTGGTVPMPYPFSVFNSQAKWVGTAWLEDVVFYFFIYALTAVYLFRSKFRSFFYFSLIFLTATIFVEHRDIARYSLPLWPMAIVAFDKFITSKKFLIAAILILPAIYLYAWNFLGSNIMPIADWKPFL